MMYWSSGRRSGMMSASAMVMSMTMSTEARHEARLTSRGSGARCTGSRSHIE